MIPSPTPPQPAIYQLRIVLRGVSPLIWRRLLVPCHTSLAHLHDILQIAFAWSGEHLYNFHIHGQDYRSHGADASHMLLREARWRCGELDDLREAVDRLEAYQAFQPDYFDRGDINRQLLAWGQEEGAGRCR